MNTRIRNLFLTLAGILIIGAVVLMIVLIPAFPRLQEILEIAAVIGLALFAGIGLRKSRKKRS